MRGVRKSGLCVSSLPKLRRQHPRRRRRQFSGRYLGHHSWVLDQRGRRINRRGQHLDSAAATTGTVAQNTTSDTGDTTLASANTSSAAKVYFSRDSTNQSFITQIKIVALFVMLAFLVAIAGHKIWCLPWTQI